MIITIEISVKEGDMFSILRRGCLHMAKDSISLILDNGICFVGDLETIEYLDAYDGNSKLKSDWNLVMSYNPKKIYYAHANEKILWSTAINSNLYVW